MPDRTCELPDCDKARHQGQHYYGSHYMKKYRYGDPYYKHKPAFKDLTGHRFGRLVAVRREANGMWRCHCDCGGTLITRAGDLNRGSAAACADKLIHKRQQIVGYAGAHDRVEAAYGLAKTRDCVDVQQAST